MSTITDAVLSAIDGGARDRRALIEATGFEAVQVTNALSWLRMSGKIEKGDAGWSVVGATTPKQRATTYSKSNGDASKFPEGPRALPAIESKTGATAPGIGEARADPKPDVEPTLRVGITWAIDHRGKLILSFGDAAFELQPRQWKPLARFLRQLEPEFA